MNILRGHLARWLLLAFLAAVCLGMRPVLAFDSGPYDIRVEQVDSREFPLVTLYVTVASPASDEIIGGLTEDQFSVTEDGRPVEIVDFSAGNAGSISTVLTIDRSGSMEAEGKLNGAKEAAHVFVNHMRPQDQVALVVFDNAVTVWQDFTSDQSLLSQRIDAIGLGNGTAWYDGVWRTVDMMAVVAGRRNGILLSDGKDLRESGLFHGLFGGNGSEHGFEETIEHARASDVVIHTIGLGAQVNSNPSDVEGFDEDKLKRMAVETGGIYHHSPSPQELRRLYLSFAENTQKEYVITVRSGRASYDGTRRDLAVEVGGSMGSGGYVEQHLLNVSSSSWAALAFVIPLALALVAPLVWRSIHPTGNAVPAPAPSAPSALTLNTYGHQPSPVLPEPPPSYHPPQPPATPPLTPPGPASLQASEPIVRCFHCGQPVRVGARFCATCGAALPSTGVGSRSADTTSSGAVCSRCGKPLRPNVRFCSNCGQRSLQ